MHLQIVTLVLQVAKSYTFPHIFITINPTSPRQNKQKAGDGNRTHVTSLEGWSSTIELHPQNENGAVDEARTRDLHLGKVALYQLSYYRRWNADEETRTLTSWTLEPKSSASANSATPAYQRQMGMTHWRFELQTP